MDGLLSRVGRACGYPDHPGQGAVAPNQALLARTYHLPDSAVKQDILALVMKPRPKPPTCRSRDLDVTMTMTDMASAAAGHDGAVASGKGPRACQPKRRAFTAAYKARILREYDELESGRERGALLRREGLYSSHIDGWRKAREAGTENGLTDKPAGRPGRSTEAVENERLRRENEKLTAELARTKAALEVVGKAHALLELLSGSADCDTKRHR